LDRCPSKLTSCSFSCAALSRISSSMMVLAPLFLMSVVSALIAWGEILKSQCPVTFYHIPSYFTIYRHYKWDFSEFVPPPPPPPLDSPAATCRSSSISHIQLRRSREHTNPEPHCGPHRYPHLPRLRFSASLTLRRRLASESRREALRRNRASERANATPASAHPRPVPWSTVASTLTF
jgi:hypothetical protein